MASITRSIEATTAHEFGAPPQAVLQLHLSVTNPEVVAELEKSPAGAERERLALSALRLGVLALRQARGELDAGVLREVGQKILYDLESLFKEEGSKLTSNLANALKQYFDRDSGELPHRLESLLKQDGEFEQFLRQHLGPETSTLDQTLKHHLQPMLKLLDPAEAPGVQARIEELLDTAVEDQRNRVLRAFSLDSEDSALSRLLRKVTDENGRFTKDVRALVDELGEEFSLDKEDSALSRLVKKVEEAQGLIGRSLTLDDASSALSRLKRELQATIDGLTSSNEKFQKEVLEALNKLQAQRETAAKSTLHGLTFEDRLGALLYSEASRVSDICEAVGAITGGIPYCTVGDFVITLGPESVAPNARIVWEAKSNKSYDLAGALKELEPARKNRQAQVGVFVFAKGAAPDGAEAFARYGNDIVTVWDPEDSSSDLYVRAAYSVARALVIREAHESAESGAAVAAIEKATLAIERQLEHLGQIKTWAETVKNNGEKISDRAGKLHGALTEQVETLNKQIKALKSGGSQA